MSREKTIQQRLTRVILMTSVIAVLIAVISVVSMDIFALRKARVAELSTLAQIIGDYSEVALSFNERRGAETTLAALANKQSVQYASVVTANGYLFAEFRRTEQVQIVEPRPESGNYHFGATYLALSHDVTFAGERIGTVYIQSNLSELYNLITRDVIVSVVVILIVSLLAYFLSLKLQKGFSRPILYLARETANISQKKDYSIRVDSVGDVEIQALCRGFNDMLDQIQGRENERDRAEDKLKEHLDTLEQRVKERTSELEQTADELKEARDVAESATKAKASFLATMSHEIRTPMNGVIGMVDMLMQTKLGDDQHQMMRTVRDSAYALLIIINDILDFSKIEAGKLELETIPFSIRDAVEGVCETLAPNANKKGIRINIHVDPDIPDAVLGDQVRIRQILFNMGGNAVKFTDQGRVLIRAYRGPSKAKKKATVRFEIVDSGIGISKEAQADLFKEFSQAESSTTRRFGGTGLGLSICQRLTEMMNGKIEVESELGKGSTFIVTLTFPVAEEHAIKSDGHDLSGLNILFAGDDAEERELDAKYLRHWDAEVTTIGGIQEAKALALEAAGEKKPFDIIALGSAWPLENRIAEIEAMQADKGLAGMRFVLMTETRTKADRKDIANTVYIESDPLRRASFIRGIAVAAGRASPEVKYEEEMIDLGKGEAPTVEEALADGTLILVAEDNPTNRDVIFRQLNLLGYAAEMMDDGKQALEAWRSKSYAMLLTDCHMPEMDGFELTQSIRKAEKDSDAHLPILAITASTLEAEVNRCYEAGMDDFLAKPVEMPKLKAALKKWMPFTGTEAESAPAAEDASAKSKDAPDPVPGDAPDDGGDGPIDPQALKSVFGDDPDTFREILQEFVEPATSNIGEIEASFADRSADGVAKAAHKLKSSARSVGAIELADLCLALETAGKAEDWSEIDEAAPRLEGVMKQISQYIEKL